MYLATIQVWVMEDTLEEAQVVLDEWLDTAPDHIDTIASRLSRETPQQ